MSWRRVQAAGSTAGIFHAGIRHPRHKMDKAKIVPSRLGPKILKLNYPKFSYDLFLMSLKFEIKISIGEGLCPWISKFGALYPLSCD